MNNPAMIRICCLGDVMPGENHYHFGRGIKTRYENKYNELIASEVQHQLFNETDFIFYNYEHSLVGNGSALKEVKDSIYRAPLSSLGIFPGYTGKIVNVANNHFSQHGSESAQYTKKILKEKGYLIVGEDKNPVVLTNPGRLVKIWGVSLIKDSNCCNEYFYSGYETLLSELETGTKPENEIWIIAVHWGDEYITTPSEQQIILGHQLADKGFDLIVGHHPHVVQPVEKYRNSIILYSLGNFIFDQNFSSVTSRGMAAVINIDEKVNLSGIFTTVQNNYKVTYIEKYNESFFPGIPDPHYSKKLKKASLLMRLLMKVELLKHLPQVNSGTIRYLLNRG
jgi:poly-gamma-glutamate synthesis protein (capsule biosynthesis protein)